MLTLDRTLVWFISVRLFCMQLIHPALKKHLPSLVLLSDVGGLALVIPSLVTMRNFTDAWTFWALQSKLGHLQLGDTPATLSLVIFLPDDLCAPACLAAIYRLWEILTLKTHTQPLLPGLCLAFSVDISKTVRKINFATWFHLFDCSLSLMLHLFDVHIQCTNKKESLIIQTDSQFHFHLSWVLT